MELYKDIETFDSAKRNQSSMEETPKANMHKSGKSVDARFTKTFYFQKPDQPNRTTKHIRVHAKATPFGYVHDGQPLFYKCNGPPLLAQKNNKTIWEKSPYTGMYYPRDCKKMPL